MATIKAIEGRSVHQIQSGQVIVDLCSVVKELVENSLDAGATSIDIRFKNQGLDSIEIQDNGGGISSSDYETLALKHYTSKLATYDDLGSLDTFGFRGEALSSLCALSRFHVITAQDGEAPKGTRLAFEISGRLKSTEVAACQKGTVVAVEDLFYNLPVRQRELEKNIKREYGKVLTLLHAYACISVGVRFAVSNQMQKGKKSVVFSTKSNASTRDNIANVYGAKTLSALIPLDLELELEPSSASSHILSEIKPSGGETSRQVQVLGYISRPVFGEGRQTPDRQMFFVNARPCALPQISKAFNEVYKSYNVSQSPFIFADLKMDTNAYDVNVSPDKRTILLHDQAALIESMKASLTDMFARQEQTVPQSQFTALKLLAHQPVAFNRANSKASNSNDDPAESPRQDFILASSLIRDSSSIATTSSDVSVAKETLHGPWQAFLDQKAEQRQSRQNNSIIQQPISENKQKLGRKFENGSYGRATEENQEDAEEIQNIDEIAESDSASSNDHSETEELPVSVQDVNSQAHSQQTKRIETKSTVASIDREKEIPSIQSTLQSKEPGAVQAAYDHIRPRRTPAEIATITIGDKTSTAIIGSPSLKRRRADSSSMTQSDKLHSKPSSFASKLRGFAAPGTQSLNLRVNGGPDEDDIPPNSHGRDGSDEDQSEEPEGSDEPIMEFDPDDADVEAASEHSSTAVDEAALTDPDSDEEYVDEADRKQREEERVQNMVRLAEEGAAMPTQNNLKRATNALKGGLRKDSTIHLGITVAISCETIREMCSKHNTDASDFHREKVETSGVSEEQTEPNTTVEERLSLAISRSDFVSMHIVGQFNLGFILATRSKPQNETNKARCSPHSSDDLFIIDQHASDEIYNFSRLSLTTTLTPQPLAQPLFLNLTAIEEETVLTHAGTLSKNGFVIAFDDSGNCPVGHRCKLLALPTSKDTVFDPRDLEELVALLADAPDPSSVSPETPVVRPTKVRRMLAMRACRSSIMVGRELTKAQMRKVVRNMGIIERPWNCPHGRPTMRHLAGLGDWRGWREGHGLTGNYGGEEGSLRTDWSAYVGAHRGKSGSLADND